MLTRHHAEQLVNFVSFYNTHAASIPFLPAPATVARTMLPFLGSIYSSSLPLLNLVLRPQHQPQGDGRGRSSRSSSRTTASSTSSFSLADLDLTSLVTLLAAVLISIKLLSAVRRAIWGWIRFAFQMGFVAVVLAVGTAAWARGGEAVWDDVQNTAWGLWKWWTVQGGREAVGGWVEGLFDMDGDGNGPGGGRRNGNARRRSR